MRRAVAASSALATSTANEISLIRRLSVASTPLVTGKSAFGPTQVCFAPKTAPRGPLAPVPTIDEISAQEDSLSEPANAYIAPTAQSEGEELPDLPDIISNAAVDDKTIPPEKNEALMIAIDCLCDDFFNCRPDVLGQFARSRGVSTSSKAQTVARLIDKAQEETVSHGQLKYTNQLIGKVFGDNVKTAGVRQKWTDQSLEASFVEAAAERHIKFATMASRQHAMAARMNGKRSEGVMKRLMRSFTEEFHTICDQAVQGVHRLYRTELEEIMKGRSGVEILSPFCTNLVTKVNGVSSAELIGNNDVIRKFQELGLYKPTIDDNSEKMLENLMLLMEPLSEAAVKREEAWLPVPWAHGQVTAETEFQALRTFLESNRFWELDDIPSWVREFAIKFGNWESVLRNDVKLLENAPSLVFSAILSGVALFRLVRMVYGEKTDFTKVDNGLHGGLIKSALKDYLQDDEKVIEVITQIHAFLGIKHNDGRFLQPSIFSAIDSQLQSMLQESNANPAETTERIAIVLRQGSHLATQADRMTGLFPLLCHMTNALHFHFRFAKVFSKLSMRERNYIRKATATSLIHTLSYHEKELSITPIGLRPMAFLSIVLLYMCLRSVPGGQRAICERFTSVTGKDEFGIITLGETDRKLTASDLRVALPPQLTYNSWLDRDGVNSRSVYGSVKSGVLKGGANDIMLLSQAPIIKALDSISKVPWRISKYMLYVQEEIVRQGYGLSKIRPSFYPLHYTNKKSGVIVHEELDRTIFNHELNKEYTKQRDMDWRRISELRSSRVHYLQALRQARALVQYSHVYFPNSLDFRGRMYPIPGRLNHTGSDPFRALLEHAEPKPLGTIGLYWLKVHLANKMGQTKLSFDDRVRYADDHIEDIVNSAEAPLAGDRWWQEGAEPMQALMACKELADAMKCSQGPEAFLSHIPVAVDGSYNGLQHYSAIGRDVYGGELVNLIPSEKPADAYTGILKEMMKSIERDAKNNKQVALRCIGTGQGQDRNHIKRKTIKRPIMTQVYGVTGYGMQEQIFEELYRQNFKHGLWTRVDVKEMSKYIRDKVLESLGVTFKETQECRKWLDQVTRIIWKCQPTELRNAFSWTTPLGLIVRQPYRTHRDTPLFTYNGFTKISAQTASPASAKQLSAIAPNLIHSLDATHLAMTALEMQNRGLCMMAVHDSFWTYACDLPTMSQVLREQFVALYDNYDPLFELKEQWEEQFFFDLRRHGMKLPDPPKRGDLDLKNVLNSPYFFS